MNESKHTPGPWRVVTHEDRLEIQGKHGIVIQHSAEYYPIVSGNKYDWLLMAAAPDLLRYAELAAEYESAWNKDDVACMEQFIARNNIRDGESVERWLANIRTAAIAKAKGGVA